jgi:signal transduction histidine kinase/CheY-like chemotaxis protein
MIFRDRSPMPASADQALPGAVGHDVAHRAPQGTNAQALAPALDQQGAGGTLPEDGGELEEDSAQSSVDLDALAEAAYFSMLAHDLRGPFSVMLAEAHEIARTLSRNGVSYDLSRMNAAAELMNLRIGEAGWGMKHGVFFHDGTPPLMTRVPVEKILAPLRALYRQTAQNKGKQLSVLPSKLSMVTHTYPVHRILENLVRNAIAHSVGSRITIGARKRDDAIVFVVADSGVGLTPHHRRILVGSSQQPALPSQVVCDLKQASYGIGLYTIRRLTEDLGGRIEISANLVRKGFVVEVILPGEARYESAEAVRPVGQLCAGEDKPLKGKLIAVLDDDHQATRLLETSFAELGAVVGAQNEQGRFIAMIEEWLACGKRPDLIVLDFFLEGGTVLDVWTTMLERYQNHPPATILLTGAQWQHDMSAITRSMPIIAKPFSAIHLSAIVAALTSDGDRSFGQRFDACLTSAQITPGLECRPSLAK